MRVAHWWMLSAVVGAAAWACDDFEADTPSAPATDAGSDAPAIEHDATPPIANDASQAPDADAAPARPYRYVFVTAGTHVGKFTDADAGLAGADQFCANEALGSPLAGLHWHAWLGTWANGDGGVNPRDRIADAGTIPYDYRLGTGEIVFRANYRFVEGDLVPEHNIDHDQRGNVLTREEVWTGSAHDGTTFPNSNGHCLDWTDDTGANNALTGYTTFPDAQAKTTWTAAGDTVHRVCDKVTLHHLYCFEVDP